MGIASVELSWVVDAGNHDSVFGHCIRQEELTISGTTATMATPVASADIAKSSKGALIARIATSDTGCYFAYGTAPDPTSAAQNADPAVSSARRWIPAGAEFIVNMFLNYKVAVHS